MSVLGEPGIGKSRLVAEFEQRALNEALVLHGRCLSYGEALGYWALAAALKEAAGITGEQDAAAARARLETSSPSQWPPTKSGVTSPATWRC